MLKLKGYLRFIKRFYFLNLSGGVMSAWFGLKIQEKVVVKDIPFNRKAHRKSFKSWCWRWINSPPLLAANGLHGATNIRKTWKNNKGKREDLEKQLVQE